MTLTLTFLHALRPSLGSARARSGRSPPPDAGGGDLLRDRGRPPAVARQRAGVGVVAVRAPCSASTSARSRRRRRSSGGRPRRRCSSPRARTPATPIPTASGQSPGPRPARGRRTSSRPPAPRNRARCPPSAATPCWFQLYVPVSEADVERVVRSAEDGGFEALVVTLDAPIGSLRRMGYVPDPAEHDPFDPRTAGGLAVEPGGHVVDGRADRDADHAPRPRQGAAASPTMRSRPSSAAPVA